MRKLSIIHLVILLCLSVFTFSTYSVASQNDGLLKIYFFDVGQGDSILIISPNQNQVLIDGGPDNKVLQRLGEIMPFYDRGIDAVIISHPHADHIGGLISVLERYEVKNIIEAKELYNSAEFKAWQEAAKNERANSIEAIVGRVIDLGDGVTLEILHPFESVADDNPKNPHDDGVVIMLRYDDLEVMLTGDMETKVERRLIIARYDLDADVLKVGHHGSKTSTSEAFLAATTPEAAIIQVGAKNRYGHPAPEVLSRLENFGIRYYRTDTDGDVKLISDGQMFSIVSGN